MHQRLRLRHLALASALGLASMAAAAAPRHAPHAHAAPAAGDPMQRVYVVTAQATFDAGLAALASSPAHVADGLGRPVVIAELRAHHLEDLSRHVHVEEHRCGGYFAFESRGEAEAFVRGDRSAHALGAQPVEYSIDNQATVDRWLPKVREERIRADIEHLSTAWPNRHYASTSGRDAALWIRDHWRHLSRHRDDVSVDLFTDCGNCGTQPSVILTIQGNELADEIVVLGGHLDSISSSSSGGVMDAPGADDDASGIATLSEVLRVAMQYRFRPQRTVMFMGYAAEEVGLRGSRAIAQRFAAEDRNVVGVLQMDMTNYRAAGATTDVRLMTDNSNAAQVEFMAELFDEYLAPLGYTLGESSCGYACSDHASWTQAGFPAGMYDEGPFFPLLHTPADTLANLGGDAEHATIIARLGLAFMGELAKSSRTSGKGTPPGGGGDGDGGRMKPRPPGLPVR
jgi:bacterial leucyl aminopeptidase